MGTLLESEIVLQPGTLAWDLINQLLMGDGSARPYEIYAQLHELGDAFVTANRTHVVIGHEAVAELTSSPAFKKNNSRGASPQDKPFGELTPEQERELAMQRDDASPNLVMLDAPDHTRLRRLVQNAFLPKQVQAMRGKIIATIDDLLGRIDPTQPVDMSADFGVLFAPEIMAELIGLPSTDRAYISELTAIQMRAADPAASFEIQLAAAKAGREQRAYVRNLVGLRRAAPQDDLVTSLVGLPPETISEAELVELLWILYVGGYETTAHMIGNGLVALLNHPDQFALLRGNIDRLVRPAVEEMLRFDGAISLSQVYGVEGATFMGGKVEADATYLGMLTAANRDPDVYEQPNRFIIERGRERIQSFGGGSHFCLGIHLAKLELELVFATLVERFPNMRLLQTDPPRSPLFHQQSHLSVPVLLAPAA